MNTSSLDNAVRKGILERIDGFYIRKRLNKIFPALLMEVDRLNECIEYYNHSVLEAIEINRTLGGAGIRNLDFLLFCKETKAVFVVQDLNSIEGLLNQTKVEYLQMSSEGLSLDFGDFEKLKTLRAYWCKKWKNLHCCQNLQHINLNKYKSKVKNLSDFPVTTNIEKFGLVQSNLESLEGLSRFSKLNHLELSYMPKFRDISELKHVRGTLRQLELEKCKAIEDYSVLTSLKNLERLIISDCAEISSIKFIESLPSLEFFSFVGTNVVDGNMTPCLSIPKVGFSKKRHYSHSPEQIEYLRPSMAETEYPE